MKKILFIMIIAAGMVACENQEPEFPDFDYTAGYFPYHYPVRTLILGDYIFDNENDNNHKFLISAAMGGVYANKQDRVFEIEVAPELADNVLFQSTGDTIRLLPPEYYTLSSSSKLTIPAGEVNGSIEVQLNDAFFDDTLAHRLGYVIPIRIVSTNSVDTVLRGKSAFENPDPRVGVMWEIEPKDFTMFAVNYINEYDGRYLHRGANQVKDGSGATLETTVFRTTHIVDNAVVKLSTTAKNEVVMETNSRSALYAGVIKMKLAFDGNDNCVITGTATIPRPAPDEELFDVYPVTGTGKFVDDDGGWGGKKRDALYVNYEFTAGADTFSAADTLVARDRGITLQLFTPQVY